MLSSQAGHRWQYSACTFHSGYVRLYIQTHNMQYLSLFHHNNAYTNAPHCYVIRTLAVVFSFAWLWEKKRDYFFAQNWPASLRKTDRVCLLWSSKLVFTCFFTLHFLALPLFRCQAHPYEIFGIQSGKETDFFFFQKFGCSLSGSLHESVRRVHTLYISVDLYLRALYLIGVVFNHLTLTLLTWRLWGAPNNASKWQMGFNSAFRGLNAELNSICPVLALFGAHHILYVGR